MVRNSTNKRPSPAASARPAARTDAEASPQIAPESPAPAPAANTSTSRVRSGAKEKPQPGPTSSTTKAPESSPLPATSAEKKGSGKRRLRVDDDTLEEPEPVSAKSSKTGGNAKPQPSRDEPEFAPTVRDGVKSFKCRTCSMTIKMDAALDNSAHKCSKMPIIPPVRPRKRLRGLPPYQYLNEEDLVVARAAQRRTAIKKPGAVNDNKPRSDPERDAWLRDHVMGKVYNKDEIWCRYCGCQQASGFSRGPWGPKKLCTIHYVQWFKKKALDLSGYVEEPFDPINRLENTEFDYVKRMNARTSKENGDESE